MIKLTKANGEGDQNKKYMFVLEKAFYVVLG